MILLFLISQRDEEKFINNTRFHQSLRHEKEYHNFEYYRLLQGLFMTL